MRSRPAAVLSILVASGVAFASHVLPQQAIGSWISSHTSGIEIKQPPYGLEVTIPAALTAVEYGAALWAAYWLLRRTIPERSTFVRAVLLSALSIALSGALLRLPIMQLVIGNPFSVTAVQTVAVWLPFIVGSFTVAYVYDGLSKS